MASQPRSPGAGEGLHVRQGAYLPHWTMAGATYAVTFRLADSLPAAVLESWRLERDDIVKTAESLGRPISPDEDSRLRLLYSDRIEAKLDSGLGACWIRDPRVAAVVAGALRHFSGVRYDLLAWCVMPNHVHAVVSPRSEHPLAGIVHSWKSYSAHSANRVLQRNGEFWQAESYDHLVRDPQDLDRCVQYVLENPVKAGLHGWKWMGARSGTNGTGG